MLGVVAFLHAHRPPRGSRSISIIGGRPAFVGCKERANAPPEEQPPASEQGTPVAAGQPRPGGGPPRRRARRVLACGLAGAVALVAAPPPAAAAGDWPPQVRLWDGVFTLKPTGLLQLDFGTTFARS